MRPSRDDIETRHTAPAEEHQSIWPSILYFGTPVALVTTMNADETPNIGPMSSAWALGYTIVMGWESTAHTLANLRRERECVINLPGPALVEEVETLAPLTGQPSCAPQGRHVPLRATQVPGRRPDPGGGRDRQATPHRGVSAATRGEGHRDP